MGKTINISIGIVTHNNEKIIKNTINSIVNNIPSGIKYEIYVIDNCSKDNTIEVVNRLQGNIQVISLKTNKGFGYGHNIVLNKINSKYHFIVNPDITIESPEVILNMLNYMEVNTEVGMLSPLIVNPDMSIQYLCKTNPTVFDMLIRRISPKLFSKRQDKYVLKDTGYNNVMKIEYASGCFMLFRTEIFQELNGFDDDFFMYLEDADITRRVNHISTAIFYPYARVIHAWERGSYKSIKLALITIQSMRIYFKKWGLKLF